MRLATYRLDDSSLRAVRVEGDEVVILPQCDVGELLEEATWRDIARTEGARLPYDVSRVAPLVSRPPKIWCVGMNYAGHLAETNQPAPAFPTLFAKFAISLIGPRDAIRLPRSSDQIDWEVELAVVIGRRGYEVTPERAMNYVAGYSVINDISMRDWQRRTTQYLQGKTFASSTPLGPHLVTVDEAPNPGDGIAITCTVNGDTVQTGSTGEMVFGVPEIVSYLSQIAPLEPGDVIATGTPAGIGALHKPPRFLQPGDVVESSIDGVGVLRNECLPSSVADCTDPAVVGAGNIEF